MSSYAIIVTRKSWVMGHVGHESVLWRVRRVTKRDPLASALERRTTEDSNRSKSVSCKCLIRQTLIYLDVQSTDHAHFKLMNNYTDLVYTAHITTAQSIIDKYGRDREY